MLRAPDVVVPTLTAGGLQLLRDYEGKERTRTELAKPPCIKMLALNSSRVVTGRNRERSSEICHHASCIISFCGNFSWINPVIRPAPESSTNHQQHFPCYILFYHTGPGIAAMP